MLDIQNIEYNKTLCTYHPVDEINMTDTVETLCAALPNFVHLLPPGGITVLIWGFIILNLVTHVMATGSSARRSVSAGEAGNWDQHQFRAERPRLSLV